MFKQQSSGYQIVNQFFRCKIYIDNLPFAFLYSLPRKQFLIKSQNK